MQQQPNINIPSDFLSLAKVMGLNDLQAGVLYTCKTQGKPVTDLVLSLLDQFQGSEKEARRAVNTCWKEYAFNNSDHAPGANNVQVLPTKQNKNVTYLDSAREGLERAIGNFTPIRSGGRTKTEADRIVCGSDLHGLFCDERVFAQFCEDPAKTAIVAGDILDLLSLSRFRQTIDHVSLREELADGRAKFEKLSRSFEKVYFVDGNHDKRAIRKIQDVLPQIQALMISPLDLLTVGLDNVHRITTKVKNTSPRSPYGQDHIIDYCGMVGDILVGHFDNFCGPDAPKLINTWITDWSEWLEFPTDPRVVLQAHTHALNSHFTPKGRLLVSTGCMCRAMPYQIDSHGKYRPPTVGYVALYQKDGITDLNRTQIVYAGEN